MIDTIVIRVHNLDRYDSLIKTLQRTATKGYSLKSGIIDSKEDTKLKNAGYKDPQQRLEIMEIHRTGEYIIKTQVGHRVNVSHHYAFAYRIDMTRDLLEFNFSIPKYKYGTNVLQFVEHSRDRDYKFYDNSTLPCNLRKIPRKLLSFILNFFKREFPNNEIDFKDVEINRIDVCFNQIFRTKEDALFTLDCQKKLKKKYSREEDSNKLEYNTSFIYTTNRSSFKVYHKGEEFRKHDCKQLIKINEEKGHRYFNTTKLQEFADRMLRYEVTIRNGEMNYLFKHHIFRKDCPLFKIDYKNYCRIGNKIKRNGRIAQKIGELPEDQKEEFRRLHPYEKISKEDKHTYRYVSRLMERKPYFMIEIEEMDKIFCEKTVNYNSENAKFSSKLIRLCLRKLMRFIKEFQIQELPNEEKISLLIDEHNRLNKSKVQKKDMIEFYNLVVKYGTFKKAAEFGRYSRATLYRYKAKFKKIGITEKNVRPDKPCPIPKAAIDFKEYHAYLSNQYLLKGIKIF